MSTINDKPTYIVIVAISVVGMIAGFVIFTNSSNSNVPIMISAIVSLASLAYGIHVSNNAQLQPAPAEPAESTAVSPVPPEAAKPAV